MAQKIRCPHLLCGSKNVVPVTTKKHFSVGKAVVGNTVGFALGGVAGGLIGAATGFNGKKVVKFQCLDCGRIFEAKV